MRLPSGAVVDHASSGRSIGGSTSMQHSFVSGAYGCAGFPLGMVWPKPSQVSWARWDIDRLCKRLDNGGVCEGFFVCGKAMGYQACRFADGGSYRGGALDGKMDGAGERTFKNTTMYYLGTYRAGLRRGYGEFQSRRYRIVSR